MKKSKKLKKTKEQKEKEAQELMRKCAEILIQKPNKLLENLSKL